MFYLNNSDAGYPAFETLLEALRASQELGGEVLATSPFFMGGYQEALRSASCEEDRAILTSWRRENFED